MSRSVWKGPFVELSLMKKVQKHKDQNIKKPIKTWSRKSTIIPEFIGMTFPQTDGRDREQFLTRQRCCSKQKSYLVWLL